MNDIKTLQHFVVIYKVTDTYVEYMDPADGEMHRKTNDEFKEEWTGVLILLDTKNTFVLGNENVSMFRRFLSLLRPHRSVMTQALFGAVVYSVLGLSMSISFRGNWKSSDSIRVTWKILGIVA